MRNANLLPSLLLTALSTPLLAQDIVVFRNGDRLTGKIERMEKGKVVFDSPALDSRTRIDWNRIERIESSRTFQIQTRGGGSFLATISPDDSSADMISVETAEGERKLDQDDIVFVAQTVEGIGGLLEISAGLGFAMTRSNNQRQLNADATARYDTPKYVISGKLSSLFTTQKNVDDTKRNNITFGFRKKFKGNWGLGVINDYLTSSQQRLDLRVVLGGGPTYDIIENNRMVLRALGGAVWNNERFDPQFGADSTNNELEALGGIEFSFFQFRQWGLDTTLYVFPSLSAAGRLRTDWNTTFKVRLIRGKKLWWNINGTVNLDSDPPSTAPGNDYYATTSISYDFP